jgi:hypothetical protein
MNLLSRLQSILGAPDDPTGSRVPRLARIVVEESTGVDSPRVFLSPGSRLIVENRTGRPLTVSPLDFFGNSFGSHPLAPGESSAPLVVTGLWFQVDLHSDDHRFYPLDVYLAPNGRE